MQDTAYVARSAYEFWNARDFGSFADLFSDDSEFLLVGSGMRFSGPAGAREFASMWADALPDGKVEIEHMIVAGEYAVVEFTGRGTHTGPLRTSERTIEATGRSITLSFCEVIKVSGGKIHSVRSYFDSGSLMMQLGLMAEAGAETRVRT